MKIYAEASYYVPYIVLSAKEKMVNQNRCFFCSPEVYSLVREIYINQKIIYMHVNLPLRRSTYDKVILHF